MPRPADPPEPSQTSIHTPPGAQLNPDHEYEDATESNLDHTRPPRHQKGTAGKQQGIGTQQTDTRNSGTPEPETHISIGKP